METTILSKVNREKSPPVPSLEYTFDTIPLLHYDDKLAWNAQICGDLELSVSSVSYNSQKLEGFMTFKFDPDAKYGHRFIISLAPTRDAEIDVYKNVFAKIGFVDPDYERVYLDIPFTIIVRECPVNVVLFYDSTTLGPFTYKINSGKTLIIEKPLYDL